MSKARIGFIFFVISAASSSLVQAQTSLPVASGKVVEPGGQPVGSGVPLQVEGPAGKTVVFTDTKGQWSLYNLPAGTYKVGPLTPSTGAEQAVNFSVKDKGLIDKLFGSSEPTLSTSDIKLK